MSALSSDHAKGLLITAIGGLVLTADIPLIRLADGDAWSILLVRSAATFTIALLVWTIWRLTRSDAPALIPGRAGLAVAVCYALGSVAFVTSVFHTATANLVFILAFNPMFAALLGWVFLKETPRPVTLAAMVVMAVGVLIIVGDGMGSGNLFGDLMALFASLCISVAITISRASRRDMGFTALVAVILPCLLAAFMTSKVGFRIEAPWWILLNGAVVMPLAFFCLATGPKYITGPEVAMFYLLETVLTPVWVWMIFSEGVSGATLLGGAILVVTLLAHSLWQLGESRKQPPSPPKHPV